MIETETHEDVCFPNSDIRVRSLDGKQVNGKENRHF